MSNQTEEESPEITGVIEENPEAETAPEPAPRSGGLGAKFWILIIAFYLQLLAMIAIVLLLIALKS